ncbi:MAG: DUF6077 domain-containing protein [Lachnospiraceae bacterium]|nr:DUF6077 domain-containing protein [Lachnospiraceae bacterium]
MIVFLIIVPFLIGLLGERLFDRKGDSLVFSRCFAIGFAIMLAVFQIIAPPMIIKGASFNTLLYSYTAILVIITVMSVVLNANSFRSRINNSVKNIKSNLKSVNKTYLYIGVVALVLIVFQTSLLIFRMHTDTDDARFIVEALDAINSNTLLRTHPITGVEIDAPIGEMIKEISSPYPIWIAVMSVYTNIMPAVLAHFVFPIFLIPLSYAVAYLIGIHVFSDINKRLVYLFIAALTVLFSFESVYTWGYTMLTIIWQGRSISAVVMLPLLWYALMKVYTDEKTNYLLYIAVAFIGLANANLSGMGALMAPLIGGGFAVSYVISNKKIVPAVLIVLAVIPAGLFSLIYKIMR